MLSQLVLVPTLPLLSATILLLMGRQMPRALVTTMGVGSIWGGGPDRGAVITPMAC